MRRRLSLRNPEARETSKGNEQGDQGQALVPISNAVAGGSGAVPAVQLMVTREAHELFVQRAPSESEDSEAQCERLTPLQDELTEMGHSADELHYASLTDYYLRDLQKQYESEDPEGLMTRKMGLCGSLR